MPRVCTVCSNNLSHEINIALISRESYRAIARQFGVSKDALSRHSKEHLPDLLVKAKDAVEVAEADTLLERLEGWATRIENILDRVEEDENYDQFFRGATTLRGYLETIGEITKELNRTPQVNVTLNPQWIELRTNLLLVLDEHPEAKDAVIRALGEAENAA